MSIYLSNQPDPANVQASLDADMVHAILLIELRFLSGTVYLSNEVIPFTDPAWGHTWQGLGNLVGMSDVEGSPDNLAPVREYSLGIPWEFLTDDERAQAEFGLIPALVTDRPEYVGQPAILWEQILDDGNLDTHGRPTPVGIPTALHFGLMDTAIASYSPTGATMKLTVEGLLARKGAPVFGRLTDRDQRRRSPGDKGLRFVPEVMSTNPKWTDW